MRVWVLGTQLQAGGLAAMRETGLALRPKRNSKVKHLEDTFPLLAARTCQTRSPKALPLISGFVWGKLIHDFLLLKKKKKRQNKKNTSFPNLPQNTLQEPAQ